MEISLFLINEKITAGRVVPAKVICEGKQFLQKGKKFYHWAPAQPDDDIKGHDVLVTGVAYGINHRKYDLSSGYALKVRLTPKNILIPYLRIAKGKEIEILKDKNGIPNNAYWPIIVKTWKEIPIILDECATKTKTKYETDIVEEAFSALNEITNISENFDFPDLEEEE